MIAFIRGWQEGQWEIASYIASFIINVNVTKKSDCKSPDDLNPLKQKKKKDKPSTRDEVKDFNKTLFG